jgi:GGDEF domain-containing protein
MELVEKRVLHLSTHDQLTGMPNKIGFDNKIDILAKGALENNTSFAIIMLDIDSLRYVKNTLGYEAAEEYIVQIALKLRLYCGQTKFISHYSYNRFIIIFEGTHPMEVYGSFIKGIYALFSQPLKDVGPADFPERTEMLFRTGVYIQQACPAGGIRRGTGKERMYACDIGRYNSTRGAA